MLHLTTPRLPSTTPPRHRSTTRLRMLPQPITPRLPSITQLPATTPRLQLITPPQRLNTTPSRPSTTPPRFQSITPQRMLPRPTTPKLRSITLPRATSPKSPSTIPRLRSTTQLHMRQLTSPMLQSRGDRGYMRHFFSLRCQFFK
jgi:hypothetical protein